MKKRVVSVKHLDIQITLIYMAPIQNSSHLLAVNMVKLKALQYYSSNVMIPYEQALSDKGKEKLSYNRKM